MDQDQLRAALADMAKRSFALNSGGSTTIEDAYRSHMANHFGVDPVDVDVYYDTEAHTLTASMRLPFIDAVPVEADLDPEGWPMVFETRDNRAAAVAWAWVRPHRPIILTNWEPLEPDAPGGYDTVDGPA